MSYVSTTNQKFLATLEDWLQDQDEILLLIRYSAAAGSKEFEFFPSFSKLTERIRKLPPRTCVTAFKQPQLPLRGIIDDSFINNCLKAVSDGSEFLIVETIRRTYGSISSFHYTAGESQAELREELENLRGYTVAVGPYPPWHDSNDVVSAVVPDENGAVTTGIY